MALSTSEKSLCNKLYGEYFEIIAPVKQAKGNIKQQKNMLLSALSAMGISPPQKVTDALRNIRDNVYVPYPAEAAMNAIKNFLDRCNYLNKLSPASAALGAFRQALRDVDNKVKRHTSTVPEFNAARIANKIDSILQGLGIPGGKNLSDLLKKADEILECLSSICAGAEPTYNGQVALIARDMDNIFRDLTLIDNPTNPLHGTLDYSKIYNEAALTDEQIINVELARKGIMDIKLDILDKKNEIMSELQKYTKGGFFL